jgi:hypothetical protein
VTPTSLLRFAVLGLTPFVCAAHVEHRITVGGGGGQYVNRGCTPSVVVFEEAGVQYEARIGDPDGVKAILGLRGSVAAQRVDQRTGEETGPDRDPRYDNGELLIGAFYVGFWSRWWEITLGPGYMDDGLDWGSGGPTLTHRLRVGPEDVCYFFQSINDGPLAAVPGLVRVGLGSAGLGPVRVEAAVASLPYETMGFSPRIAVSLGEHYDLGVEGFFARDMGEGDNRFVYDSPGPTDVGLGAYLGMRF